MAYIKNHNKLSWINRRLLVLSASERATFANEDQAPPDFFRGEDSSEVTIRAIASVPPDLQSSDLSDFSN